MKKLEWLFQDVKYNIFIRSQAYQFIKGKRDYIEPNYGFKEKLLKF